MALARRIPIDVVVLLAIAIVVFVTHRAAIARGMCFNDPSWYFHFGARALAGDVPYRDYIFQVGPLPVYVDAAFQAVFGSKYLASMYAALAIKIVRMFVVWSIARRLTSRPAAGLLLVFCAFDPLFAFAHHWSTHYAQLFFTLAGLWLVLASRSEGRRVLVYLALAGASAALVVSARQSSAVMIGLTLLGTTSVLAWRGEFFTRQRFVAMWAGYAGALVVVFGMLALVGALGPAIQQMFLDAPAKKGVSGLAAVADALSGGALVVGPGWTWWGGLLVYLALPCVVVAAIVYLSSREVPVPAAVIGMSVIPVALVLGLTVRHGSISFLTDVPRLFLCVVVAFAVLAPARLRTWFGLEPVVAIGLAMLPVASDWALEMSYPGRGWGDAPALVVGAILISLASTRLPARGKTLLCGALAVAGVLHVAVALHDDINPFAKDVGADGKLTETTFKSRNPYLRGTRISEARKRTLEWLQAQVPPRSTCFVYANLPVLYTLLDCRNPTRLDSTAADFITGDDAAAAIATLRANPPEFLIAHENSWMSPSLELDVPGYAGLNPEASRVMHQGLRALLAEYDSIGLVGEAIGPLLAKQVATQWDTIDVTRVYRRRSRQ